MVLPVLLGDVFRVQDAVLFLSGIPIGKIFADEIGIIRPEVDPSFAIRSISCQRK
tara:strand:+ start:418 stop:582 length:165 start_codon:yes stop_codon:yes gene_type:complete